MAHIVFEHVTKCYKGIMALDDCSLEIRNKDFFVLTGPPLSGKSTIIRCLLGVDEVDAGHILIDGQDITSLSLRDRNLAVIGPGNTLNSHWSIYDNLAYGLKLRKVARNEIDRRVKAMAEALGIVHTLERRPAQLTGSQRQRAAIGKMMVRDPAAFILDEPISGRDAEEQEEAIVSLARVYQLSGLTFVCATQDGKIAFKLGTRIAIMKSGVVQQVDTVDNLRCRPVNANVIEFLNSLQDQASVS